jgi:hypothetical protein
MLKNNLSHFPCHVQGNNWSQLKFEGKIFYFNCITNVFQYNRPAGCPASSPVQEDVDSDDNYGSEDDITTELPPDYQLQLIKLAEERVRMFNLMRCM